MSATSTSTATPLDRIAFAVIACGPYTQTCKAETFIESLCRIGGWDGPVFLYTERPQCFDIPRLRKLAGNDLIELVTIPDFDTGWELPISIAWDRQGLLPRLRLRSSIVMRQAKTIKSRLFDLLPRQDIEVLIYSDADSIVVRNNQMPAVLKLASEWTGEGIKCRLDERDPERPLEYTPASQIHSGILILHRDLSRRALAAWKAKLTDPQAWERRDRYRLSDWWRKSRRPSSAAAQPRQMRQPSQASAGGSRRQRRRWTSVTGSIGCHRGGGQPC